MELLVDAALVPVGPSLLTGCETGCGDGPAAEDGSGSGLPGIWGF